MPNDQPQLPPNPIADLYYKLEAALKYLDKISDDPAKHQEAALDALVTDVMPGLQKMSAGLAKFVDDTIGVVNDINGRISVLEQQASEAAEEEEEEESSTLLPEDADKLSKYIIASLGVITNMPASDPSRQAMIDFGREVLQLVKDSTLVDDDGDGVEGAEETQ